MREQLSGGVNLGAILGDCLGLDGQVRAARDAAEVWLSMEVCQGESASVMHSVAAAGAEAAC